jgi:hypothetical protein
VADNPKQQPHALISLYAKLYSEKYGRSVMINRYKEKWAMQEVIDSIGYERSKELIEYYFTLTSKQNHQLQWFYYNFDRLDDMLNKTLLDNERRNMLLLKTKQMVEEGGIN